MTTRTAATILLTGATITSIVTFSSFVLAKFLTRTPRSHTSDIALLRQKLPASLAEWRSPEGYEEGENAIWHVIQDFLRSRGYTLWRHLGLTAYAPPHNLEPACNGFAYAPAHLGWGAEGRVQNLSRIDCMNGLMRAARAIDGRDVVIRVIRIGTDGESHLDVLKYISRGLCSQLTPNHAIPLFELFELGDITFGVFPRAGCGMLDAYDSWPQNSVGDIIDMILQCLETLGFLHSIGVAHRDAFKDNFLVQWHPESLSPRQITVSRPRVYLNDFETAIRFDIDVPPSDRTCVGPPLCASFPLLDEYTRPMPGEVVSGQPYDPFKLDVWQFGTSLSNMKTTIPDIDAILSAMVERDPLCRIGALEAMKRISQVIQSLVPEALKIAPLVVSQF